jgi:HK97 family phage major capsid protein
MASALNKIQERAAAVAAILEDLSKLETRTEEQDAQIEALSAEATELEERLAKETAIARKIASLRGGVQNAAAPVADGEDVEKPRAVAKAAAPATGRLRGVFANTSDAEACGRWIRGFLLPNHKAAKEDRAWYSKNVEERALSPDDNSKGGVFIPETFASSVIRLVDEYSAIPKQANVMPMSSNTLYVPRRTGGNTAYFVQANQETTVSDMATDNVMLSAKDVRVGTRVPNRLIDDSVVDLASLVAQEFALALSKLIDDSGFKGDGTATYGGIRGVQWIFENNLTYAGVSNSAQTAVASLTVDDFHAAISKCPSYALPSAGWYVTPQLYHASMRSLALSSGGVSAAEVAGGVGMERFLGFPVYFNNSMRTSVSTDQVVCLFGDMKKAAHYGVRKEITVRASTERYVEFDQTYFSATAAYDVVVSDVGDTSTAGPVVALVL